ncbi:DUF5103 domain-containing protein [bacterium]|nr:DUF5103 domain-containing protein [bacterium]
MKTRIQTIYLLMTVNYVTEHPNLFPYLFIPDSMKKMLFWCLLVVLFLPKLSAAQLVYENKIFKDNIRTVQFKSLDEQAHYPVLQLGTEQKLFLNFDDLDGELKNYQYTIVHCDYNWQKSNLMQNEYIQGSFYDYITQNETSFNTYIAYTHYQMEFPGENLVPKLSGNYALIVYENNDPENLVLVQRFFIFEGKTSIQVEIKRPTYAEYYKTHQEVDVWVTTGLLDPVNPNEDYKIMYMQNGRWDNVKTGIKPRFFSDNRLDYNYEDINLFKGGNEYRYFDARNIRFGGMQIMKKFQDTFGVYNAVLYADKDRSDLPYVSYADFNGFTLIDAKGVDNKDVEGDYVWVNFWILTNGEVEGDVYLFGSFTNWQLNNRFKLTYVEEHKRYEAKVLLKQGYYNYCYAVDKGKKFDVNRLEGSFYQTENDYQVFFYMYSRQLNCDLLVGYKKANSITDTASGGY